MEIKVSPMTVIRRERLLPVRGTVLVNVGEFVEPLDIVARAELITDFRVVDVARELSLLGQDIAPYLLKAEGDEVEEGEVIAARRRMGGLLRQVSRSPIRGRVMTISGGRVLISAPPVPLELHAYLKGRVARVMPSYGVVIETTGALIQGLWGMGGESSGVLKMAVEKPHQPLVAEVIDVGCYGTILVGGSSVSAEALYRAQEMQVKGIVVGGVEAYIQDLSLSIPIVATEGLGKAPMSSPVFDLLREHEGKEASISTGNGRLRPEIIIPLPAGEESPPPSGEEFIKEGLTVRITRAPYQGEVGKIKGCPPRPMLTDLGVRLRVVEVQLREGTVFVPLANIEILR